MLNVCGSGKQLVKWMQSLQAWQFSFTLVRDTRKPKTSLLHSFTHVCILQVSALNKKTSRERGWTKRNVPKRNVANSILQASILRALPDKLWWSTPRAKEVMIPNCLLLLPGKVSILYLFPLFYGASHCFRWVRQTKSYGGCGVGTPPIPLVLIQLWGRLQSPQQVPPELRAGTSRHRKKSLKKHLKSSTGPKSTKTDSGTDARFSNCKSKILSKTLTF